MRKSLLTALLAAALLATPAAFSTRSDAANPLRQDAPAAGNHPGPLPNYDIRLAYRDEFDDTELNTDAGRQRAAGGANAALRARAAAVENFRAGVGARRGRNLRAEVNEAGALKNFFIDGAALSGPQSNTPDNVARGFLKRQAALFGLSNADVNALRLEREDDDRGTTFLDYAQTVGGVKVFEGSVKVVVGRGGEVLNVRQGFVVNGQKVNTDPSLSEAEGIARAFEHAGRQVTPSFAETRARGSKSDSSAFANPLGPAYEDVLSELSVVRVKDEARLAWHVYAEVGPDEWYELLVDAHTGELLLRHNLYVFEAQGTVYTEAPDKGARQLVSFVGDTVINTAAGWMGTSTVTTGNNVEAYLDTDANNAPDNNNTTGLSNGHAFSSTQNFTFPFSVGVDPRTQRPYSVTNLFYFCNIMHDFVYGLGFTESAGNFQTNNFGRGGTGNDSVRAEAQDGSGTNNANFATPPDGSRP